MYNPQNLHACEVEKERNPRGTIDTVMTIVGVLASLSSIPQVLKIWETGNVSGISLATHLIALVAVLTWMAYGFYIRNKPLMITSSLSAIVLSIVVFQIMTY